MMMETTISPPALEAPPVAPMLAVKNLSVAYGQSRILHGVSLDVQPGQVSCLMGRNGAGKTTAMKAIMGLLKARTGTISLAGEPLDRLTTSQRSRAGISYVPQGRGIFPYLSVYENLLMGFESYPGGKIDHQALEEQFEQFSILKTMRHRVAGTLSGGQQQQLALARALVSRPKLLLLDEPTEGIQPSIVYEIEELLISLSRNSDISILVVEQFLDFARTVADQFYIMETGQIVESGPIANFSDDIATTYLAV